MITLNSPLSYLCVCLFSAYTSVAIAKDNNGLENIVVIGKHSGTPVANLAGSYEVIGRDQLDYLKVDNNVELLTKIPGVAISRWNQGPINANISIRGFAGDGPTPHVKLLIDGIPANTHAGLGEIDQTFSLNIDAIHVFKGTSDARFGLFNLAGNYEVLTRNDTDVTELDVTFGSFNTKEIQGYTGHETGKLKHSYAFGYRDNEGYRDNTDLSRYAFSGKWFYDLSNDTKLGYIARFSSFDADSPGYLSLEDSRSNPRSSGDHASVDGGDKTTTHHSIHLETSYDQLSLSSRAFYQTLEVERWVRFSEASSLSNRYSEEDQFGFLIDARYALNDDWTLLTGLSYQSEDILSQRFAAIGQARQRGGITRNQENTLDTTGIYVSIENQFNDKFEWNIGLRTDKLDGDFSSTSIDGSKDERDIYKFGWIVQPKLNLFYQASKNLQFFFNFGESFQHPTGSSLYTTGDVNARDVSQNIGWELGSTFALSDAASLRLSAWRQDAEDEFVVVDGDAKNVGETERKGWEAAFTWSPSEMFNVWANYSSANTEIVHPGSAAAETIGNELRSIPAYTSSIGVDAFITESLIARIHVDSQGDYYVNEANKGGKFGSYTITNLSLDYQQDWGTISLNANNIFDEYHEYVYDLTQDASDTIHSPGDGESYSLSVRFSL